MYGDSPEHFALDMVSEGVLIADEDGTPVFTNKAFRDMMRTCGLSPDDLGLELLENGDSFVKTFAEVMQGGADKDTRVKFSTPNGVRFSIHLKIALKRPSTIVCLWTDLKSLDKPGANGTIATPERDLTDYQRLFYELFPFKVSAVEVDEKRRDLFVVWQSPDMLRTIAKKYEPFTLKEFWLGESGFPKDDLEFYVSKYLEMIKAHPEPMTDITPPWTMERINTERQGERVGMSWPFHTKAKLAGYAASGRPLVIAWNEFMSLERLRNIDHNNSYDDLLYRFSVLQRFFNSAPLAMGLVELVDGGPDTVHLFANQCAGSYCQKTPETLKGARASTFCDKTFLKTFFEHYKLARDTGQIVSFETVYRNYTLFNYVAHIDGPRFMYVAKDITEDKAKEAKLRQNRDELEKAVSERTKQLEEAMQVKSRFLACMSHEIRTPLSGIMGAMNLLGGTPLNPEQNELLRVANVCGEQLLVVINDILDLTRMEYNKVLLETLPFPMHDALDDALEIVAGAAEKKNLELICEIIDVPEVLVGDKLRLRQILVNLLSNAVKFTHTGEVILSARGEDLGDKCKVTVSVKDSGIGIPESVQKRLLQPFSQGDNSTTRRYGGSGLGLYICKKICELMGGSLWLESTVGCGSTFHFAVQFEKAITREQSSGSLLSQAVNRGSTTSPLNATTAHSKEASVGSITPIEQLPPTAVSSSKLEVTTMALASSVLSPRGANDSKATASDISGGHTSSSPAHHTPPLSGTSSQHQTPRGGTGNNTSANTGSNNPINNTGNTTVIGPPSRTVSDSFPHSTVSSSATVIQSRTENFRKRNSAASLPFSPESSLENSRSKVVPPLQINGGPIRRVLIVNENTTLMKVMRRSLQPLGFHVKMYMQVTDCLRSESCKPSDSVYIVALVDARLPHLERLSELHKDVRKVLMGYHQPESITDPNILFLRKPIRHRALKQLCTQLFEERERALLGLLRERASSVPVLLPSLAGGNAVMNMLSRLNESTSAGIVTSTTISNSTAIGMASTPPTSCQTSLPNSAAMLGNASAISAAQIIGTTAISNNTVTTAKLSATNFVASALSATSFSASTGSGVLVTTASGGPVTASSPNITPEGSSTCLNLSSIVPQQSTPSPPALSPQLPDHKSSLLMAMLSNAITSTHHTHSPGSGTLSSSGSSSLTSSPPSAMNTSLVVASTCTTITSTNASCFSSSPSSTGNHTTSQLAQSGSAGSLHSSTPTQQLGNSGNSNTSTAGPRILVAEDNNMNQLILKRLLNTLGYLNVKIVSNGKEAVEAVRTERFELVLMDIMMPEMGGLEAAEIIRADASITDQPRIVAVTANAFAEDRVKCLQAGMDEVITKPIRQNELADAMRVYVKSN